MPVRPGAEAPEQKGAPKSTKGGKAKETATTPTPVKEGTVKKSPLIEKVKKMFDTVDPTIRENIFEEVERQVTGDSQEKTNVAFFQFSPTKEADEFDNDFNVDVIKDILFAHHTMEEKTPTGNPLMVEVLPPANDGEPHTLCVYEVSAN